MKRSTTSTFPSLRARMGDWHYYATIMSLADVARWITRTDQIHSNERLREWIQRELQEQRIGQIAGYIRNQPQHFFNAIVVGIYDGEPEWFPVTVRDSPVVGAPELGAASQGAMGLLRLKGSEKVFAIDGQHRVEGIKKAVEMDRKVGDELLTVLFVAHSPTDTGRVRTRRLFSTLNRQAKPVSRGEIVALDEDDAFAVVTRQLVEGFEPLKGHRVAFGRQTPMPKNNAAAVTTILGLYDLVQAVSHHGAKTPKALRDFTALRPKDAIIQAIHKEQIEFWKALIESVPAIREAVEAPEVRRACARYRHVGGGNLLFRPAGQKAFARAVRLFVGRNVSIKRAVKRLDGVPLELAKPPWASILWDPTSKVMITRTKNVSLATNILLLLAGATPRDPDTKRKYKELTGRSLPNPLSRRRRRRSR